MKIFILIFITVGSSVFSGCSGTISTGFVETDSGALISLYDSSLSTPKVKLGTGATTFVTLTLRNASGETVTPSAPPTVTMSVDNSSGTSRATLGEVSVSDNGSYFAVFTAISPGSPVFINATVDGEELKNPLPISVVSVDDDDFSTNWTFASTDSANYEISDGAEIANGLCRVKSQGQADDNGSRFTAGTSYGATFGTISGNVQGLRLGSGGGCNGLQTNCAELDSSWAPQWSHLVNYLRLNGTIGAIANNAVVPGTVGIDGTAKNTNGTGMEYVAGKFNQGIQFDGVDDKILLGTLGNLGSTLASGISASLWFSTTTTTSNTRILGTSSTGDRTYFYLTLNYAGTAGKMAFSLGEKAAGFKEVSGYFIDTSMMDGNWHHLIMTAIPGTNSVTGYLDGVAKTITYISQQTPSSFQDFDQPLALGTLSTAPGGQLLFPGRMDEFALWNSVLTANQAQLIYSRQSAKYAGTYTSRVFDSRDWGVNSTTWSKLSWLTTLPFGKELPRVGQSETASNYRSLSPLLTSGLLELWHLNEVSGTTGAGSIHESSGSDSSSNGTPSGGLVLGNAGRFGTSASFNGSNSTIDFGNIAATNFGTSDFSVGLWIKTTAAANSPLVSKRNSWSHSSFWGLSIVTAGTVAVEADQDTSGTNYAAAASGAKVNDGNWHFVMGVRSGPTVKIYVDGALSGSNTAAGIANIYDSSSTVMIGFRPSATYFTGSIDEVSIWSRALSDGSSGTPNEIFELYRRGANRIRYQVRSCADAACSSGSPSWIGPDGTIATYFSELNNNTIPLAMTGNIKPEAPSLSYADFAGTPSASTFFQYRAFLESDDPFVRCNYGSGNKPCSPEIESVAVDAPSYSTTTQTVVSLTGADFNSLTKLTDTLGSRGCDGGVSYNLSLDHSHWYWWNSTARGGIGGWVESDGSANESNSAEDLEPHLKGFQQMVGAGSTYLKAFLKSDGTSPCELDNVKLEGFN